MFVAGDLQRMVHHLLVNLISKNLVMSYQTILVEELDEGTIIKVTLHRPKNYNALNMTLFSEVASVMKKLNTHPTARVVVLEGHGKYFTSGLDLKEMGAIFSQSGGQDPSRSAIILQQKIKEFQQLMLDIYECRLPVIAGMHRLCIGAGMDLISGTDIRYCTKDCVFSIREIKLGITSDLGVLTFFPKVVGNNSAFRELAYTGRDFTGQEALQIGFVSKIFDTQEELQKGVMSTAREIASKSPVGIYTLKKTIKNGEKDIYDNFDFVKQMNAVMFQSTDPFQAFSAYLEKRKPNFPKL